MLFSFYDIETNNQALIARQKLQQVFLNSSRQ